MQNNQIYDVLIVGGGPAGMSAGIYALRAGAKVLMFEKNAIGGQTGLTYEVKNYPAFTEISGFDLVQRMFEQYKALGGEVAYENVTNICFGQVEGKENQSELNSGEISVSESQNQNDKENTINENATQLKSVTTSKGEYFGKTLILALGAGPKRLGIERETDLLGKGISNCAVCDGAFFRGKNVAVIGGGNSAFEDAKYLANIANKVYLINRSENFRAQNVLVNEVRALGTGENAKIQIVLNSGVSKILGEERLTGIEIQNHKTNETQTLDISGLFIAIGREPDTKFLPKEIKLDDYGYIVVDDKMQTSVKGVYACGDCIAKKLRQIVTACADGAIAGNYASEI